jgi:selenoprotein W-related protein
MTSERSTITIAYCTKCRWLLRASWMAQELLSTFAELPMEVLLRPSESGTFTIHIGDELIWCRKEHGGFPDIKVLKGLVRDRISPEKLLGHSEPTNDDLGCK